MAQDGDGRPDRWDMDADVVVAGYGFAGAMAAISAQDAGARVLLLEKMAHPGGNSILSGGAVAYALDAEKAFTYLQHTCAGTTPDTVLRVFAEGMTQLPALLEELLESAEIQTTLRRQPVGNAIGVYPFPGGDTIGTLDVGRFDDTPPPPWITGSNPGGRTLFKLCERNVERRPIDVHFNSPVRELITDASEDVIGVCAEVGGREVAIRARRSVVLATGGFEHNEQMKLQFFQAKPVYAMSPLGNTGDGIAMAQKVGAALWHMWHYHGSYGYRVPGMPMAARHPLGGGTNPNRVVPWIVVDRHGKRFMNETHPAPQDTNSRPLDLFDPDLPGFPRIPSYVIVDEPGRLLGPLGRFNINDERYRYDWSRDNSAEIEAGLIKRASSVAELAASIAVPAHNLGQTIETWNAGCATGGDPEFSRPPGTMAPIGQPPFYALEAWPLVTNTQGGPQHNARQQIIDPSGKPIPRLYAAGEMGSLFGHLYLLCGNNAECFVGGRIAGRNAAAERPWA